VVVERIPFLRRALARRVTVKRKSGLVSNILVTNWSVVCIVISGRFAIRAGLQLFLPLARSSPLNFD